ncbi:MAG TPA: XRE family transcriptional regulator, partial [Verrucomicrobiae bacterium]|nr:XRE family transcriptional regulator [Verrucomicrobiae bacterium]
MEKHFNPEMLVLARESRAFTQGDVAEKLKITQSLISKIEHGVSSPTDEILVIISAILHYPRDFFFQPDPVYGLGVSFLFHRKRQTMPAADLRVIQAKVNILRMRVERLLRGVEMVSPYTFTPIDIHDHSMRRDGPEHIAGLVRAAWQLPSGPVRNLVSAIENAGGIVFSYPFGHRKVDAISLWVTGSPPLFFVNSELPGERQRFTLAHELGHVIMHRVPNENIEEEADRFAAAFLMPETDSRMDLQRLTLSRAAALKPY